jgi:hypothetical protein
LKPVIWHDSNKIVDEPNNVLHTYQVTRSLVRHDG